ncbi:SDR family oxidoreductase [Sphingobacterium hungaricum]|uniref:Short-chain dehydrogenase n=1 Tax=Sphingobacterium hungaricum TaxID=2082723 RepID=A0A928YR34_9SPHI|nr:SDR family oxidoreductase [Sphingobacterium hungaricum]MBE8714896.1 short-chain dehydrogenase [Sphingobacterium hungaricum]
MEIVLNNKKALVGGSTSGIGKAIAFVLASCGAEVVLMSRNEDKLKAVLSQLPSNANQKHSYLVTDFNDFEQHKHNLKSYFANNEIDILVNNTNGPSPGNVLNKDEADYQQAFDLLFQNAVYTSMLALPYMQKQNYGRIINVSSMTVKEPQDSLILSNTMRTALVSWSKSLSNEVAKDGITVNSILTGYFDTERLTSLMENQAKNQDISLEDVLAQRKKSVPINRLGDPKEYGYLVAFLASEYASFLTGAAIPLDGGIAKTIF